MNQKENNYAFIDSQNLHLGISSLGWKLDHGKFRRYLKEKYGVKKAYLFIGFVSGNQNLYNSLQTAGFALIFKPTIPDEEGKPKGNVDVDLALQVMIDLDEFEEAVIVTSDGDFYSLVRYLYWKGKLSAVLSPNYARCSGLLRQHAREKMMFMENLRGKLEYKKTPPKDEPLRSAFF